MYKEKKIIDMFLSNGGVLTTKQFNNEGITSYTINRMLDDKKITRISRGHYIYNELHLNDHEIISSLFPEAIIYLQSALLLHEYTERIPNEWIIAVSRNMKRNKYDIDYIKISAHFVEEDILKIGLTEIESYLDEEKQNSKIVTKIYDKDKTICDVIKHRNKIDQEVFNKAIRNYINDSSKNLNNLYTYARELNILGVVETYIGVWF
jgi:predicted transcriptional regulator of viral defense system